MDEWGFMYQDRGERTLANRFPKIWQGLASGDERTLASENGLFTYAKIYPVTEADRSSTGAREAYSASRHALDATDYHWILVSRVSPSQLAATGKGSFARLGQLYLALLALAAFGAWLFAKAHQASMAARLAQQRMAERLAVSNGDLEEFAYIASHDLQEPLRKVIAFGERLETKYADTLDEQGKDYLNRMKSATRRMQTLINDLLTYSRVSSKAQPFVPVNLAEITREVLADLETRILDVKAKIEVGELPVVEADPLQMRQLMQNLIGNTLKFNKPDEPPTVTILSGAQNPADRLGSSSDHMMTDIVVQDDGIGFQPRYVDRIFGTFQRLHGRNEHEITGIGLSVCRKIAERHGGSIKAQGKPDQGARFIVSLPLKQEKEDIRAAA